MEAPIYTLEFEKPLRDLSAQLEQLRKQSLENNLDLTKAAKWMDAAVTAQPDAFYLVYRKALIQEKLGDKLWVSASCSLLHVPVDLANENKLDAELKGWLAFDVMEQNKEDEIKLMALYCQKYGALKWEETTMVISPEVGEQLIGKLLN